MIAELFGTLAVLFGIAVAILVLIFVAVPILKGVGWLITNLFQGIGFLVVHVFDFITGMIRDVLRLVGTVLATIILVPLTLLNVVIGRWSAAGHFAAGVKREFMVFGKCLYRLALQRPLRLLFLHSILEGVEERVPEAMAGAPARDKPNRRTGQFPGYTIVGSLRAGGSGAKLYIAEPDAEVRARVASMPEKVVIKSFALGEGSTLPQIVRESRALECAKQLGHVYEHGMDAHRFYYVMPYIDGDHLGIVTRQLHAEASGKGLGAKQLPVVMSYVCDLVDTLDGYHRGGLWHKDVKPENVIVHDGRAHLVDLGLVTPLRSAMTLTTHGTEYFRDPEMVRQALRGVKVHQVDGAKFDVYAAGAVLYFLIENDFPAHGGLSRFTRKSPEAIKWIVRRAMADYQHRYTTAEEMLSDLRFAAHARDLFEVKPADLPSMSGNAFVEATDDSSAVDELEESVAAIGIAMGAVDEAMSAATEPRKTTSKPGRRPRILVTNWWTGKYDVEEPVAAAKERPLAVPVFARHGESERVVASEMRHEAAELRERVRAGTISARRAAREQVRSARARAKDMRRRAQDHRRRVAGGQPSGVLAGIGVAAMLFIGVGLVIAFRPGPMQPSRARQAETFAQVRTPESSVSGPALLVMPAGFDPSGDESARRMVAEIVKSLRGSGVDVRDEPEVVRTGLGSTYEAWCMSDDPTLDAALSSELTRSGFGGILVVSTSETPGGSRSFSHRTLLVPGASEIEDAYPTHEEGTYLLVNDHPAKHASDVAQHVDSILDSYEDRGWTVVTDDDVEARVREIMPIGDTDDLMTPRLQSLLAEHEFAGIVFVRAGDTDGATSQSVRVIPVVHRRTNES